MNGIQRPVDVKRCHACNIQNQGVPRVNPDGIAEQFVAEYYRGISNYGWSSIMHLFDPNSVSVVRDRNVGNMYNLLCTISTEHIQRANYDNIRSKWIVIDENNLLINVFGQIQFVDFYGTYTHIMPFTESFILTSNNNTIRCTKHIFDF